MRLCKHDQYKIIDWIKEPKYSTDQCLINVATIDRVNDNYLVKFTSCSKYPDWFYFDYKTISKSKKQPNGRGEVYAVDMSKRQELEIIKNCPHSY